MTGSCRLYTQNHRNIQVERHIWRFSLQPPSPGSTDCKVGQVGKDLVQLHFEYAQQWRSHHVSWPCPRAAPLMWEGVFLLMCNQNFPCCNVSLLPLRTRDILRQDIPVHF